MAGFIRVTLLVAQLLAIPVAGCLFGFDSAQGDWTIARLGALQESVSDDISDPRKFRFRIPRASEIRDLIPKRRSAPSPDLLRSTAIADRRGPAA